MLGVRQSLLNKVSKVPSVKHTWMAKLMAVEDDCDADEVEDNLYFWTREHLQETRKHLTEDQRDRAISVAWQGLPYLMEAEAISELMSRDWEAADALMDILTPEEAVELGRMERLETDEIVLKEAELLLKDLMSCTPPLERILKTSGGTPDLIEE